MASLRTILDAPERTLVDCASFGCRPSSSPIVDTNGVIAYVNAALFPTAE